MELAEILRRCVTEDKSISKVARDTNIPQPTLQEFVVGKSDGTYSDLRLSSAQLLIEYYEVDRNFSEPIYNKKGRNRMILADELTACECGDSPEKFRERLIEALIHYFPGRTIDSLICTPVDSLNYCNMIREGIGSECLFDSVILKSLVNIRKMKECPTGLKNKRTRVILRTELNKIGCNLPTTRFRELVVDCLADMYKSRTVDEIVCHPREARALCNYVRNKANLRDLSDNLILRTLMNCRKSSGSY